VHVLSDPHSFLAQLSLQGWYLAARQPDSALAVLTAAQQGDPLQPFCGAEISTSTPVAFMSTQIVPEAMQSSTNKPPTACTASATALR
jgi:hypothetical protein